MKNFPITTIFLCCSMYALNASAEEIKNDKETSEDIIVIEVESEKISDVSVKEVKSADLAESLSKKIPGISLVRRSGIANDIILRGQKKDNINILIDNAKIYGACPNRMDPPTSHILTNNINEIEVIEGPYDVENFGTLSGAIKIKTNAPEQKLQGNLSMNLGSWDYEKFSATISGGNEKVRALVSFSQESGGQYEDGDGHTFSDQIEEDNPGSMANYKSENESMDAFQKSTFMGKIYAIISENQEIDLSYTANRSDDVLYPSSPMDALYDDSNIFNLDYRITNIGHYSDLLEIQIYDSTVEHPMSTFYRLSSGPNSVNERISYLETQTQGTKIINEFEISESSILKIGLDINNRNWDGEYEGFGTNAGITGLTNIPDVDTENRALFIEVDQDNSDSSIKYGVRFDDTSITPNKAALNSNDYSSVSAFVFSTYQLNATHQLFGGIGKGSRVPDARELYFQSPMGGGMLIGNPDLDETTNTEFDIGIETSLGGLQLKTKFFYSSLEDFIHYNASKSMRRFDNVDATIYGLDFSGYYKISPAVSVDFGLAYQKGKKDDALPGQTDKDLAEIPPMKGNVALNYEYSNNSYAMMELVAANSWDAYDADNGEQKLNSWAVMNLKVNHQFNKQFGLAVGIDNLFDKTYALSNTYKDLTLLADGSGEVMLMNEPGRYLYLNGVYSF